jgi:hypothetical protein
MMMALAQFVVNSVLVALAVSIKTEKTLVAGLERLLSERAGHLHRRRVYGGFGV